MGEEDEQSDKNETLRAFSENFYKQIQHDYDVDPQVCSVMYPIDTLELLQNRVQVLESLCVIEKGLRTIKRGRRVKRLNIDERYSKMRYTIIPHNATSVDAFAASPLSTDAHVKTIQTLLQE